MEYLITVRNEKKKIFKIFIEKSIYVYLNEILLNVVNAVLCVLYILHDLNCLKLLNLYH